MDNNDNNDYDNDDVEGAIARNLFRLDDDSDEDDDDELLLSKSQHHDDDEESCFTTTTVMNVTIQQRASRAGIAHRLWPAAEYLANYIVNAYNNINNDDDDNNNDNDNNDTTLPSRVAMNQQQQRQQDSIMSAALTEILKHKHDTTTTTTLCNDNDDKNNEEEPLFNVLELGAGVGLTGLVLATKLPCRVLLTDLQDAMPLLETNIALNKDSFRCGPRAVSCRELKWGSNDNGNNDNNNDAFPLLPLLVVAADCVYFQELHQPLETTLMDLLLLQTTTMDSVVPRPFCLMAGARRWKRDNAFYANLAKRPKLACVCLEETVTRTKEGQRDIMRVYGLVGKT